MTSKPEKKRLPSDPGALSEGQQKSISSVNGWRTEALVNLGIAHLDYNQALAAYSKAKKHLDKCERAAREAESQHGIVMSTLAQELKLSPGEWTYDEEQGKLVAKEQVNAKPS